MRYGNFLLLSMLFLLAACRDPGAPNTDGATAAATASSTAMDTAKPSVERKTTFVSPIAGAITTFPFAYHVSVDREVNNKKTREKAREIGIEFLDANVADVGSAVTAEFEKAGFKVASSESQGRAARFIYVKEGHGDVLAWVRPGAPRGERYALQMPDAKGTVYLAYPLNN